MKKVFALVAAFALALPAVSAQAEDRSITVEYGDLNLASARGQERLTRRIESAARKVCGFYSRANASIIESSEARACYKQAKAGAMTQFAAAEEQRGKGG